MKIKTFLLLLFTFTMLGIGGAWAQNDEYYRPDSLRTKKPVEYQPAERKAIPAPQEAPSEFSLRAPIDRVRLGGSFGLSFGTVTSINLSPMAGYELTENLVGGVGGTIMYFKSKAIGFNEAYYGGRLFAMYSIFPEINLQSELETLSVKDNRGKRVQIYSPMIGVSYSPKLGGRFTKAVHFSLLYNLNYYNQADNSAGPAAAQTNLSPYGRPFVFRVTFL